MELSVKEFSELVGLMMEARAEAAPREVTPVPLSAQSGTRVVVDTAEIQRVVGEAVDVEREAIAGIIANAAAMSSGPWREALERAVEMVRARVGRR